MNITSIGRGDETICLKYIQTDAECEEAHELVHVKLEMGTLERFSTVKNDDNGTAC